MLGQQNRCRKRGTERGCRGGI